MRTDARSSRALRLCLMTGVLSGLSAPMLRAASPSMWLLSPISAGVAIVATYALVRFSFDPLLDKVEDREALLREQNSEQEFMVRLTRALERARSEAAVLDVTMRAVGYVDADLPAEVLLADSSRSHLRRHAAIGGPDGTGPGCRVVDPWDCPALSTSQPQNFDHSDELDCCPHLRARAEEGGEMLTAVCLPMGSRGQVLGVLHVARPAASPIPASARQRLDTVAGRAGVTIGVARAFVTSQIQAATDPLTGLLNRRSLEERCRARLGEDDYSVIAADLDHFKALNDLHGHAAGDRALRTFAHVLQTCAGSDDIIARMGGEEFVIVCPGSTSEQTLIIADDIHQQLRMQVGGSEAAFTVSLGIADGYRGDDPQDTLARADEALFAAKTAGRDRTWIARREERVPHPRVGESQETASQKPASRGTASQKTQASTSG